MREFLFVAAPKVMAGACAVVVNLVLLRYLRPEDFGLYALSLATINIADAVLGTAVDMSVIRLASPLQADQLARSLTVQKTGFYAKIAISSTLCVPVCIFASSIERIVSHQSGHSRLIYLTCAAILALMVLRSAQVQMQIENRFALYSMFEFLQVALKFGGIGIVLLIHQITPAILLACFVIGPGTAGLLWTLGRGRAVVMSTEPDALKAREFLSYLRWFLLTFSVAAIVARIDIFLVSIWSSVREAGIFSAGQVFATIPQLIGTYLAVILSPRVMPYFQQGLLLNFFRRFQTVMIAFAILIYLLIALTLPRMGSWLLPAKFMAASHVILLLLPGALAGFVTFPLTITVVMFLRPKVLILMDCVALPIVLLAYRVFIPSYGAVGAAWVTSAVCIIKATIAQFVAWRSVQPAAESVFAPQSGLGQICLQKGEGV